MQTVVLVTGGASGLGNVIAEHFAALGQQVILSASTLAKAEAAIAKSPNGHNMVALKLDISVEADFHQAVASIEQQFGRLDVLINNATVTKATPVLEISAADFDWVTQVNQRGTFQACQIIGKYMASKGTGRIVNMASLAGQNGGTATGAHYAATKGAIVTLTKIFAREFAAQGVTVNAIALDRWIHPLCTAWCRMKKWHNSSKTSLLKPWAAWNSLPKPVPYWPVAVQAL